MPLEDDLERLLREHGGLREGHFLLASGNHSGHYVQTAQLLKEPHLVDEILDEALPTVKSKFGTIEKLLTAATGGITFAQQVGLKLRKTTIFAERDNSNQLTLERGFDLSAGERVLLVEDVVTTGGTLSELQELVEQNQAQVTAVLAMVNRSDLTEWEGRPFRSLLSLNYPVYTPEECPLCKDGGTPVRPGTKTVDSETVTGRSEP